MLKWMEGEVYSQILEDERDALRSYGTVYGFQEHLGALVYSVHTYIISCMSVMIKVHHYTCLNEQYSIKF